MNERQTAESVRPDDEVCSVCGEWTEEGLPHHCPDESVATEECTHSWRTCPVHGTGTDELPPFRTVVTCIYGGAPLADGGTWDDSTSNEVVDRVCRRIEDDLQQSDGGES